MSINKRISELRKERMAWDWQKKLERLRKIAAGEITTTVTEEDPGMLQFLQDDLEKVEKQLERPKDNSLIRIDGYTIDKYLHKLLEEYEPAREIVVAQDKEENPEKYKSPLDDIF